MFFANICLTLDGSLGCYKESNEIFTKTKDYMLVYRKVDDLEIVGYTDSDFAGCQYDMKSTLVYIFMFVEGAVFWKNVKQTLLASSIMQVEFVACYEAVTQTIWFKNLIFDLDIVDSISKPLNIYCDNRSIMLFFKNNKSTGGSKHIEIKYLTVKDFVKNGSIIINYIGTNSMIVDP